MARELTEREREVLELIIQNFILTATPVGSRFLSKKSDLKLSDATIRNVMFDLESEGYITHPHTSAGRVPTDKGYRFYVDSMMHIGKLAKDERLKIDRNIGQISALAGQSDDILRESSRLLGRISRQIGVVLSPSLSRGIFEKLEIVPLSSSKIMVILSLQAGLVKTIMLEVRSEIPRSKLEDLARFINERIAGLTLQEIRQSFAERVAGENDETGLIRIFIDATDRLFDEQPEVERIHIGGKENILSHPEFEEKDKIRGIFEFIENENVIVHLLEEGRSAIQGRESEVFGESGVRITIGKENMNSKMNNCSIITAQYAVGGTVGTVGVIGPTRMDYSKVVRVIDYVAQRLSSTLSQY
ncbi:MAG: heat-inducible transcriptional repressor HrcA [Chloroherpetonaceae bacterium]|nr:heat-inducible transcriptional repressor HrcA [Chloroherpetonaceae bacterium]